MSILKKPYEIAVYDDVLVDGVFVEKRLGIIGKDTMTSQCRVIEPNLIRNTNGQNKFSFKMYKKYIDTITGEEVDNPFVDWLVSERKVKLYYKDKWYDFIVKDINENSSNYLYTYQLDDANVQELSKNGFGVTLDAELMNNIGTATQLGAQVMEETDWTVDGDVAVQTVSEALVYVQMPSNLSNYEIYHLSDQVAPYTNGVGKTLLTNSTTPKLSDLAGKVILAFYSSCKNKPHRFQFIYSSKGYSKLDGEKRVYALDRKDDRTIIEKDCQYYIDFDTPETDYSVRNSNYDLYLPTGFSVVEQSASSGDTTISSWYRGARYGYAHQSVYVPLLERYCQKFIKDEPVNLYSSGNNKNIELYQDGSDGGIDGTFNLTSGKVTGFTTGEAKNSPWSGIKLALDYSILDTFEVSYKLTRTDGILKTIGGHNTSFDTQFSVYSDAARTNKLGYTTDSLINLTGNPGTIYVTAYYTKKRTTQTDSTPFIFIQPNRSLADGVKFVISELSVKRKGDYLGYTTSEFISPTLIKNCITDYKFESGSGWTATASAATSSADKAKVDNVYGRFVSSKFVSIVEDFLAGTYNESNIYTPYMKLSFKNGNQFILNSGIYDNRTMIQNMPQNEEWVLDYEIVNSSGYNSSDNFRFSLGEYLYNTSTGLYNQRTGFISFTGSNATTHGTGKRIVFTVNSSTYDVDSFKKNSRIYLKIEPTSVSTSTDTDGNIIPTEYYIKKIALYKKSRGADGEIIYPDYEEEQSAAAEEWVENGTLERRYIYFNSWHINSDNPDAYTEKDKLPTITKTTLDYSIYKPVYNEGAEKVRTVTAKESNYFNILQSIAETFEQWMIVDVERNTDGSIKANGKKIHFRNYRNSDNHACFRYGVNLKDIQRTTSSKNIVTKLIVKQNANELAENGFCTIQRAGANPTGENYIYDFQYHQNTGIMPADEYLTTNYCLTGAEGPDGELWSSGVTTKSTYNLKGYFPRLKKINDSIVPINDEIIALQADLVKRRAEKEVADSTYEAAVSGIEEVREDFLTLTGVYPEEAQNGEIQSIVINGATPQEDWAVIDTGKTGYTNGIKVENQTAYVALKISTDEYIEEVPCEIQGADNTNVVNLTTNAKKITTSDPNGGLRIATNWDEPSGGFWRTYTLTYELELLDGELKNIGCSVGRYSGFSIKVTNAQGQEAGSYNYAYRSIYTMNNPQKNTKYLVTVRGGRSSTNTKLTPDLWIQPNRGLSDSVTCRISNIKLSKLLTSEEVTSSRAASRERKVDVYIDATITLDGGRTVNRTLETTCIFQPRQVEAVASQPIAVIDTSRSDVQKYLTEYTTYFEKKESSTLEKNTLQPIIANKENAIKTKEARRKQLLGYKKELNKLFFNRYSRFIQEGTWINEEYVDDEKYFADAQSVLYNSCYPQVGYGINVLELSAIPGYEMFSFEPGEKTWVIDPEFFGEDYREEVIITELSEMLDDPSKNMIKVQNFKNQFQDLFQKITATVQQTQYNVGSYEKGAALVEASAAQKSEFITSAINSAQTYLNAGQTVKQGVDGITITDDSNAKRQLRLVGGAILFSAEDPNTKETRWRTGLTNEGISADLIKAGKINTGEIQIMTGDQTAFRWDAYGISAYDALWTDAGSVSTISGVNSNKFVRFDKHGIYGIDGQANGQTWHPSSLTEIDSKATFALTWDGLKVTSDNAILRIGDGAKGSSNDTNLMQVTDKQGNEIFAVTENGSFTWTLDSSPTKVLYARTKLAKPTNQYDTYAESNTFVEDKPTTDVWHKTQHATDWYVSYSYDGGNTWSDPSTVQSAGTKQVIEWYFATADETKKPTRGEVDGEQKSIWKRTPTGENSANHSAVNKYLWNYEETVLTNDTSIYSEPVLISTQPKAISKIYEFYQKTTSVSKPNKPTEFTWNGTKLEYKNGSSWTVIDTSTSSNNGITVDHSEYLWNFEVICYDDNSCIDGPVANIGYVGIDAYTLSLNNDADTIVVDNTGSCVSNLPITIRLSCYIGNVKQTINDNWKKTYTTSLEVPTEWTENTHYTFDGEKLEIRVLPNSWSSAEFVFTWKKEKDQSVLGTKTFSLKKIVSTVDYDLIVPQTVYNSSQQGGKVSFTVQKKNKDGTTELSGAGTEPISAYIKNGNQYQLISNWNGSNASITYNQNNTNPIHIVLTSNDGALAAGSGFQSFTKIPSIIWDAEVIEFTKDGSSLIFVSPGNDQTTSFRNEQWTNIKAHGINGNTPNTSGNVKNWVDFKCDTSTLRIGNSICIECSVSDKTINGSTKVPVMVYGTITAKDNNKITFSINSIIFGAEKGSDANVTFSNMWDAFNAAQNSNNGIVTFTYDSNGDGEHDAKGIGLNANCIKAGAIMVGSSKDTAKFYADMGESSDVLIGGWKVTESSIESGTRGGTGKAVGIYSGSGNLYPSLVTSGSSSLRFSAGGFTAFSTELGGAKQTVPVTLSASNEYEYTYNLKSSLSSNFRITRVKCTVQSKVWEGDASNSFIGKRGGASEINGDYIVYTYAPPKPTGVHEVNQSNPIAFFPTWVEKEHIVSLICKPILNRDNIYGTVSYSGKGKITRAVKLNLHKSETPPDNMAGEVTGEYYFNEYLDLDITHTDTSFTVKLAPQTTESYSLTFEYVLEPKGQNFKVLEDGSVYLNAASFGTGAIGQENNISISTANMIGPLSFFPDKQAGQNMPRNDWRITVGDSFGVTSSGTLCAKDAEISGQINATSGQIGDFTINNNSLVGKNNSFSITKNGITMLSTKASINLSALTLKNISWDSSEIISTGDLSIGAQGSKISFSKIDTAEEATMYIRIKPRTGGKRERELHADMSIIWKNPSGEIVEAPESSSFNIFLRFYHGEQEPYPRQAVNFSLESVAGQKEGPTFDLNFGRQNITTRFSIWVDTKDNSAPSEKYLIAKIESVMIGPPYYELGPEQEVKTSTTANITSNSSSILITGHLIPTKVTEKRSDYSLGDSNNWWNTGYITALADWQSDERVKNSISSLPQQYEVLFDKIIPSRYKYINGSSNRYHTGFIAQQVVKSVEESGLTTQDFAAVMLMNPGTDEECWYLRRDEFVALNTWQIQKLKPRVSVLEQTIINYESRISALETEIQNLKSI